MNLLKNIQAHWKIRSLALFFLGTTIVVYSLDEIPEKPEWFIYADHRILMGIANFGDVVSNILFLIFGMLGLRFMLNLESNSATFEFPREKIAPTVFFIGIFLTGVGSGWYHLDPTGMRLVWDRLPMAMAFMSIFCMLVSDHIHSRAGSGMLLPLLILGMGSVVWRHWTGLNGDADSRPYALVQFFPMLAIPYVLLMYESRYTHNGGYWKILICYAIAKFFELYDHETFQSLGCVSGHSIKHMAAGLGVFFVLQMLKERTLKPSKFDQYSER